MIDAMAFLYPLSGQQEKSKTIGNIILPAANNMAMKYFLNNIFSKQNL